MQKLILNHHPSGMLRHTATEPNAGEVGAGSVAWVADAVGAARVEATEHGSLTLAADGGFTYTPEPGFVGYDWYTYTPTDGAPFSAGLYNQHRDCRVL